MNTPLKVGILIPETILEAWAFCMIEKIIKSNSSEIMVALNYGNQPQSNTANSSFFFKVYQRFENKVHTPKPDAFKLKNITSVLNCPIIDLENNFPKSDSALLLQLKQFDLDVLINLTCMAISEQLYSISKTGIWSLRHGPANWSTQSAFGATEVLGQEKTTPLNLLVHFKPNAPQIMTTSTTGTSKISINRNRNSHYWKSASLIPRKLIELSKTGSSNFFKTHNISVSYTPSLIDNQITRQPTNWEVVFGLYKIGLKRIKLHLKRVFYVQQWSLRFHMNTTEDISTSFNQFKEITPPQDRFWADPFVMKKNDLYYIFIEELIYSENKGKIAVMTMDNEGNYSQPKTILEQDYHMSYPYIFEDNNQMYMIPETAENGTIELYKCLEFPNKWKLESILMDNIYAVDNTIFKHDDKYWLFTNMIENDGASSYDELFLFYSDHLLDGNWQPHLSNPILSTVEQSRPAGRIFTKDGKIIRPSQNSSVQYGYSMKLNEIKRLTEQEYQEETISDLLPDWSKKARGTHTINHCKNLTIIDALIEKPKQKFKN